MDGRGQARSRGGLWLLAGCVLVLLVAAACGDDDTGDPVVTEPPTVTETPEATPVTPAEPASTPSPSPTPTPTVLPSTGQPEPVTHRPVFEHTRFNRPVEVGTWPPTGDVYVVEQRGPVYLLDEEGSTLLLDMSGRISTGGNEEGLLSLVPDPAFDENNYIWLYYSAGEGPRRTVVSRMQVTSDGLSIDPSTELVVLEVGQPFTNHNGGSVRFGLDGMLYVGIGDGGAGGDPQGHGQNTMTLLGTIVRIDVSQASELEPYRVPEDNPFVGDPDVLDEIWAYGLRNPWRMDFDPVTGFLWVGDVGQADVEEISLAHGGDNLGWAIMEGDICYPPGTQDCDMEGLRMPVVTYVNAGGRCSVTGGLIYRGDAVPELTNAYLFSDWCSGELWALNAEEPEDVPVVAEGLGRVTSFGLGPNDEIYVTAFDSPLLEIISP
jgi:glucose/arabinose dehydrogenase